MPWAKTSAVQERIRFIADYESRLYSMTERCKRFGVSRPFRRGIKIECSSCQWVSWALGRWRLVAGDEVDRAE